MIALISFHFHYTKASRMEWFRVEEEQIHIHCPRINMINESTCTLNHVHFLSICILMINESTCTFTLLIESLYLQCLNAENWYLFS